MKSATASPQHFFHGTAEIDVDDVKPGFDQLQRAGSELLRLGPHQLSADGMLFRVNVQEVTRFLPLTDL